MIYKLLFYFQNISLDLVRRVLLLALIFSIVIQAGKHFWPDFSYVLGIRVDYISPTLYLSDFLILTLFLLEILFWIKRRLLFPFLFGVSLVALLYVYVPFVASPSLHLWGVVVLLKFIFVGYVVAQHFSARDIKPFLYILSFGVLIESLLAVGQFVLQSSIQGPFYILGERAISSSSYGAAKFLLFGSEILRPYGTFSHPNVLAFYLYFCVTFLLFCYSRYRRGIFLISIFLGSVALMLTFSRVVLLLYILTFLYFFIIEKKKYLAILLSLFSVLYLAVFSARFASGSLLNDLSSRKELFDISLQVLAGSYLFGNGIYNYFVLQGPLYRSLSPIFLQPVHNIYMLILLQVGAVGAVMVLFLLGKTLLRAFRKRPDPFDKALLFVLSSALFVGIFDHYFLTVQQGMMMGAVVIGLVWRKKSAVNLDKSL